MITRENVILKPSHYACGETFTEVLSKDGLELGTIWPCEDGSFDYESFITGMSWNTIGPEPIEDVVQHLIEVANENEN